MLNSFTYSKNTSVEYSLDFYINLHIIMPSVLFFFQYLYILKNLLLITGLNL